LGRVLPVTSGTVKGHFTCCLAWLPEKLFWL
jgi:hypothetical protein